jgi:hypothetical protein
MEWGCKRQGFGRGVQPATPNRPRFSLASWLGGIHHLCAAKLLIEAYLTPLLRLPFA